MTRSVLILVRCIISTDLKGIGHEAETRDDRSGTDMLRWHLARCREYGFAGWWMWAYQDTPTSHAGLRRLDGEWKEDLVEALRDGGRKPDR